MFKSLLKRLAAELSRRSLPYMVIGGQAVLLYGEPRLTKDIDITLGVGVEELPEAEKAVGAIGLKPIPSDVEAFVRQTMVLPVQDEESGIRVDLIFSFSSYERQAIGRAREVDLGGGLVRFASLEDLVIHKIVAGRARDLEDVKAVLLRNPGFDAEYIRRWLAEFDAAQGDGCLAGFEALVRGLA